MWPILRLSHKRSLLSLRRTTTTTTRRFLASNGQNDDTSWIPPPRPLAGDQGTTERLYQKSFPVQDQMELAEQEQELERMIQQEEDTSSSHNNNSTTDWLSVRRKRLGESSSATTDQDSSPPIPVLKHTWFTAEELVLLLKTFGGFDNVQVVHDDPNLPRMGGQFKGMIFCTASSTSRTAQGILQALRARQLHELDKDIGLIAEDRRRMDIQDLEWRVVDCHDYCIHLFANDAMRQALNLEALWSGQDDLWTLDWRDDDQVDDYVARNPVPDVVLYGEGSSTTTTSVDHAVRKRLATQKFSAKKAIVPNVSRKKKGRKSRVYR